MCWLCHLKRLEMGTTASQWLQIGNINIQIWDLMSHFGLFLDLPSTRKENKTTTAFQSGEKHSVNEMTKATHLLIFYQRNKEIWSTMRFRMPWHLCSDINYSWLHFQSLQLYINVAVTKPGDAHRVGYKDQDNETGWGNFNCEVYAGRRKNRPSGQCAVEPSPRCMIQDQRVNRNSRL